MGERYRIRGENNKEPHSLKYTLTIRMKLKKKKNDKKKAVIKRIPKILFIGTARNWG